MTSLRREKWDGVEQEPHGTWTGERLQFSSTERRSHIWRVKKKNQPWEMTGGHHKMKHYVMWLQNKTEENAIQEGIMLEFPYKIGCNYQCFTKPC